MQNRYPDLVVADFFERVAESFRGSLNIAFHEKIQMWFVVAGELRVQLLESYLSRRKDDPVSANLVLFGKKIARLTLRLDLMKDLSRLRNAVQTEKLNRHARSGIAQGFPFRVDHGADFPPAGVEDNDIASAECALLDYYCGDRSLAFVEFGFDHDAFRCYGRIRLQLFHFRDEQYHFEKVWNALSGFCRYFDCNGRAAPFLRHKAHIRKLLFDAIRLRVRFIYFIHSDDDGNSGGFRMVDGLSRLRHNAIVGGDNENRDVRRLSPARAHRRERLVPRRIEKNDLAPFVNDGGGADVLRDSARFLRRYVRIPDAVQKCCLSVVYMPHHRNDRRPRNEMIATENGSFHGNTDKLFTLGSLVGIF